MGEKITLTVTLSAAGDKSLVIEDVSDPACDKLRLIGRQVATEEGIENGRRIRYWRYLYFYEPGETGTGMIGKVKVRCREEDEAGGTQTLETKELTVNIRPERGRVLAGKYLLLAMFLIIAAAAGIGLIIYRQRKRKRGVRRSAEKDSLEVFRNEIKNLQRIKFSGDHRNYFLSGFPLLVSLLNRKYGMELKDGRLKEALEIFSEKGEDPNLLKQVVDQFEQIKFGGGTPPTAEVERLERYLDRLSGEIIP